MEVAGEVISGRNVKVIVKLLALVVSKILKTSNHFVKATASTIALCETLTKAFYIKGKVVVLQPAKVEGGVASSYACHFSVIQRRKGGADLLHVAVLPSLPAKAAKASGKKTKLVISYKLQGVHPQWAKRLRHGQSFTDA